MTESWHFRWNRSGHHKHHLRSTLQRDSSREVPCFPLVACSVWVSQKGHIKQTWLYTAKQKAVCQTALLRGLACKRAILSCRVRRGRRAVTTSKGPAPKPTAPPRRLSACRRAPRVHPQAALWVPGRGAHGSTGGAGDLPTGTLHGSALRHGLYGCHSSLGFLVFSCCKCLKTAPCPHV